MDAMLVWNAIIAFAGIMSMFAAVYSILTKRKVREIHVLVNSRLDSALSKIGILQLELREERGHEPSTGQENHIEIDSPQRNVEG